MKGNYITIAILNYWVMHPVARVSIKYWNNLRTQQSIFNAQKNLALKILCCVWSLFQYLVITILDIIHHPVFYLKHVFQRLLSPSPDRRLVVYIGSN
jgi:hypothetical protein